MWCVWGGGGGTPQSWCLLLICCTALALSRLTCFCSCPFRREAGQDGEGDDVAGKPHLVDLLCCNRLEEQAHLLERTSLLMEYWTIGAAADQSTASQSTRAKPPQTGTDWGGRNEFHGSWLAQSQPEGAAAGTPLQRLCDHPCYIDLHATPCRESRSSRLLKHHCSCQRSNRTV